MEGTTAARWINEQVHLMPGYRVRAQGAGGSRLLLNFQIDTVDTDDYWYRPRRITVNPTLEADVTRCRNGADLARVVFDKLMYVLAHEHREGLRVGNGMMSPFHPHRRDGERRFQETKHITPEPASLGLNS